MNDEEQLKKLDAAIEAYHRRFNLMPFFSGMSDENMASDLFIETLNQAVADGNPDIDLSPWFPDGANL